MRTHSLTFEGKHLHVAGQTWSVDYPISDACLVDDIVIVIYDYMSGPLRSQFRNAEGFDIAGRKLWTAEHPTNETVDAYVKITDLDPLVLSNFAGFRCRIDPATGRLLETVFTK